MIIIYLKPFLNFKKNLKSLRLKLESMSKSVLMLNLGTYDLNKILNTVKQFSDRNGVGFNSVRMLTLKLDHLRKPFFFLLNIPICRTRCLWVKSQHLILSSEIKEGSGCVTFVEMKVIFAYGRLVNKTKIYSVSRRKSIHIYIIYLCT